MLLADLGRRSDTAQVILGFIGYARIRIAHSLSGKTIRGPRSVQPERVHPGFTSDSAKWASVPETGSAARYGALCSALLPVASARYPRVRAHRRLSLSAMRTIVTTIPPCDDIDHRHGEARVEESRWRRRGCQASLQEALRYRRLLDAMRFRAERC
jgi:hypothetical protein